MITDYFGLLRIGLQGILILLLLLLLYKNHVISVFDPLFVFLVTQAFSIELAFIQLPVSALINFLFCQLFFVIGFLLFAGRSIKKRQITNHTFLQPDPLTLSSIKIFAVIICIIIILANIFLISQRGVALFADDPSAAKGENFQGGGFGFIRRINWGILYLCSLFLIYLILYKRTITYLLLSFFLIFILILSGSKGVLLYFISLIPLLSKFSEVKRLPTFRWMNLSKYILLGGGVVMSLVIIAAGSRGTIEEAVFGLGTRFLFFGDAILYYYDKFSVKHFSVYSFKDYIPYELNPILGFFRLVEYQRPLGFDLVEYQSGSYEDTVFGPNVPYFVKGHIFFGPVGAVVYSFVIGGTVGWVRSLFYKVLENPKGILYTLIIIHLNLSIFGLPQDSQLFLNIMFDTFFQAIPVYLLIHLLLKKGPLQKQPSLQVSSLPLTN
jgi:hypothetical protein